jgi:HK97 family phage major capsid protein
LTEVFLVQAPVEHLQARRRELIDAGRRAAERAALENRALTGEEQAVNESVMAEIDEIDARLAEARSYETRARAAETSMAAARGTRAPASTDADLRAFLAGDPYHRSIDVSFRGIEHRATLSKLFSTSGAATVPTSFRNVLYEHSVSSAVVMQFATVVNSDGGETLQVPKTTVHSANAAIVSETSTIPVNEPTFGQVTLGAYKYGALINVSRELIDDSGVDLEGYLGRQAGRALGNGAGSDFVVGNGTNKPRGVTIDTTQGRLFSTAGAISDVDVQELYSSVIPEYRSRGTWLMADSTWSKVRQLKDGQGRYLVGDLASGAQPTLLGRPVAIDPFMPAIGAAAKSVVFGDLSAYFVRVAGGVRFERSDDARFSEDIVVFRALLRTDGALVDLSGAVKHGNHT